MGSLTMVTCWSQTGVQFDRMLKAWMSCIENTWFIVEEGKKNYMQIKLELYKIRSSWTFKFYPCYIWLCHTNGHKLGTRLTVKCVIQRHISLTKISCYILSAQKHLGLAIPCYKIHASLHKCAPISLYDNSQHSTPLTAQSYLNPSPEMQPYHWSIQCILPRGLLQVWQQLFLFPEVRLCHPNWSIQICACYITGASPSVPMKADQDQESTSVKDLHSQNASSRSARLH